MEKRPEPKLTLKDYKEDALIRWDLHLYEWSSLVEDCKGYYEYLKPKAKAVITYCKESYNRAFKND